MSETCPKCGLLVRQGEPTCDVNVAPHAASGGSFLRYHSGCAPRVPDERDRRIVTLQSALATSEQRAQAAEARVQALEAEIVSALDFVEQEFICNGGTPAYRLRRQLAAALPNIEQMRRAREAHKEGEI